MPAGNPQPGETWFDVLHGYTVDVTNVDGQSIHFTGPGILGSRSREQFLSRHSLMSAPCAPGVDLRTLMGAHQSYLEMEVVFLQNRVDALNVLRIFHFNPRVRIECSRDFGLVLDGMARSYGTSVAFVVTSEEEGSRYQVINEDGLVVSENGFDQFFASAPCLPTQTAPEPEAPTLWERLDVIP